MTDKDVQREIEANEGGIVGAIEDALDPFTKVDDEPDDAERSSRRELNDAEQRRDR